MIVRAIPLGRAPHHGDAAQQFAEDPTELMLGIATARLMLRWPEAGFEPLAGVPADPAALVKAEERLLAILSIASTPLARLARAARLSAFDLDLLGLAALSAVDDRAGEAVATFAGGARRLRAGRAARLILPSEYDAAALRRALRDCPLWRTGLLRRADPFLPVAERPLDPTPALLAALDAAWPEATAEGWIVEPRAALSTEAGSLTRTIETITAWLTAGEAGQPTLLLLEATRLSRAIEALALSAAQSGRPALLLHAPSGPARESAHEGPAPWAEAGVIAAATEALVCLVSEVDSLAGPITAPLAPLAIIGPQALRAPFQAVTTRRMTVPSPRMSEQSAYWARVLPALPATEHAALAAQTWAAESEIVAMGKAALGLSAGDLLAARMAVAPPRSARLATLRMPNIPWERLILEPETEARLEEVVRRVRHRATVREAWGLDHGGPSLVAQFSGDSGTGKTLAAEAIATRLGLPLLAADLSRIVSKYIGETEKNLSELFAAAEGFAAVLFFDEADALFGKRTSVQDAHDRYANIEVNYLLQRLERFEGVALLATNLAHGMDEAFLRRFDLTVPFHRPGPTERQALWRAHLPSALLDPDLDLAAISVAIELTGGEIRNAALAAAYAAAEAGRPIGAALLRHALEREFAKQGRPFPDIRMTPNGGIA